MSATVIAHKPSSLNNSPSATSSSAAAGSLHHAAELDLKRWIREAARVCRDAAAGNLESRILHVDVDGDVGDMLHGINHLLDMTDAFVREAMASLEHVSQNKFYRRVLAAGMLGSFRRAAVSINDAAQLMENRTSALREAEARRATLDDEFQAAAGVVENLATATEQIAGISELIRHVAAQSTLLALNASIESARVGEAGKGFNVVAREVKRLADETRAATKDIANNVAEIQQASQAVADVMQRVWNAVKA